MKNRNFIYSLLLVTLLSLSLTGKVWAWGATGSDGGNYQALQETAVFFNNAGETMTAGTVALLDTGGIGVATGTTLGAYVTTPSDFAPEGTKTDSILAVGVVKSTASDQRPVIVVTKGPVDTLIDDSSDAVSNRTAVGVSGLAGSDNAGGGTNLGISLETGSGSDGDQVIIWVSPTGAD